MADTDTNIQASALATPIDGLSIPSINLRGQGATHTDKRQPVQYNTNVDPSRGPFLADTQNNIDLFTEIYNTTTVENTVNGVVHTTLAEFLHAVLGIKLTTNVTAVCVKYDVYQFGAPDWTGSPPSYVIPEEMVNDPAAMAGKTKFQFLLNTAIGMPQFGVAGKIANHNSMLGKWVLAADIIAAMTTPFGTPATTLVENTVCASQNFSSTFETFNDTRDNYGTPMSLDDSVKNIQGVDALNPPSTISIQLPTSDASIRSILVDASELAVFSNRVIDIVVNPDSIQVGPSDPTRQIKVFNTKKFNFTDDAVALSARAPTVLQSLNLIDRKAEKNFALADSVESAVWSLGVGDWRNSQSDDPNITAQLSAAGYTESGSQALRRLNLIPVNSEDKIQVLSADSAGDPILVVDESAQVNLLEATWTAWQNITNLNTDVYGISATNTPDLSATALIGELSGNSVIENLNLLYNMYLTGGDGGDSESGTDFTSIIDALSARIEGNEDSIVTLNDALTGVTQVTELSSLINTLSSVDHVTIINQLSGLTQDLSGLNALSGDVDQLEILIDNINNFDIPALSSCCDNNSTIITDLSNKINNLSVTELSGIVDALSAIDLNTYITQLSSIEQQITNLSDIQVYVDQINNNTTYSDTLSTGMSGLSADIYQQIDQINQQLIHTSVEELSAITQIINNIQNVDELIQALSGDTRISELSACCEGNLTNITQLTEQLNDYTVIVDQNTTNIDLLSSAIQEPAGVVLTTKNQTITGEKTFKSTMTVAASSYFEECMTVGDTEQPVVFNVYSVDGVTRVNIKNLPTISQINDLNPGDLYIRHVDGHDLLAVKQDPDA